jgi:hypothetical protein
LRKKDRSIASKLENHEGSFSRRNEKKKYHPLQIEAFK